MTCGGHPLRSVTRIACGALLFLATSVPGQTLYDPALGTLPGDQGWGYGALGAASETLANGALELNTSAANSTYAGYSQISALPLNPSNGFTLRFTVQLKAEAHTKTNRAGFSLILLGDDRRGLELGFWTNAIFAQADSPLFTRGEEVALDTTTGFVDYALTLRGPQYALRANGSPVLSGSIRDYTSFTGPINPYLTPDFIFLGDDTTSASATFSLRKVTLLTAPRLTLASGGVLTWNGADQVPYTVEISTNLSDWTALGTVTSATTNLVFTNQFITPRAFFRVVCP